ncbi:MAG: shikimate kinase [Clostridia bacterium]|nr:shikimate kinase [Clostridia bacterium]
MNIVLTGFMATGKTKISTCLAKSLGFALIDTDEAAAEAAGKSINEIFAENGEDYFRSLESEVIKKAAVLDRTVISTGGGAVLRSENMAALRKNGVIVNLSPSFDVIRERIAEAARTRPLMNGQSIEAIEKRFNDRKPFYDNCDIKLEVTNSKTPEEHSAEIIAVLKNKGIM